MLKKACVMLYLKTDNLDTFEYPQPPLLTQQPLKLYDLTYGNIVTG
jgi:hypothetical protein